MKKLVCREDGIEVELTPAGRAKRDKDESFVQIGRGTLHPYKHRSTRDEVGNPWCGQEALTEDDVEEAETASEA